MSKIPNPFRYFHSSPEVIHLAVMMYVRFPLSLRNVEDLLCERDIDICFETARLWWNRFGRLFTADMPTNAWISASRWHLDEMHVRLNGEMAHLVVRRGSRRRSDQKPHEEAGQIRRFTLHEEGAEASWASRQDHH
ncbi:putative transposase [Caenibius tardaugens NBRC 16725]|uniref:Putative transposase n=1 Tax=Caenibius tardaugens NBRC 16725 TaxID=1219035 RepID=U2YPY1_9SPHN|nr:putative transposase [Caenibius tardaugens NBRC 16725]